MPKSQIIPTCVTLPLPTTAAASFLMPLTTWTSAVFSSKAPPAHHCTRGRSPDQSVSTNIHTACDLNSAFAAHFAATAQGYTFDADSQDDPAQKDSATTGPTPAATS
jgi:hypothetical protein